MPFIAASENHLSCGGEHSGPRFGVELVFPYFFSRLGIERSNRAMARIIRQVNQRNTTDVPVPGLYSCSPLR